LNYDQFRIGFDLILLNGFFKNLTVIVNFLLVMRIFFFLEISPLILFYVKMFIGFLKTFFNIFILVCISIIMITLIYFKILSEKSEIMSNFLNTFFYTARIIGSNVDSEPFLKTNEGNQILCFLLPLIIKSSIFSIIMAAQREMYEIENRELEKFRKSFHIKKLGDFLFFYLKFIPSFYIQLYYVKCGKYKKDHNLILKELSNLLPDKKRIRNISDLKEYEIENLCEILENSLDKPFADKYKIYKFNLRKDRIIYLIG